MFAKVAWFEFRYQLRQVVFWVAVILFGLFAFGSVASDNIRIGSTDNVHKNAAFVIGRSTLLFAEIYMFVVAALVANVITRDEETGFGGIIRSTRIRKADYLYGRFIGAFGAALVGFLAVPVGLWLGSSAWWVDHETLGPLVLRDYLWAYLLLAAPVIFLTSSLFFAVTTVTRSMMWTYVGVVALFIGGEVMGVVLGRPGYEHIAALWEPFGAGAFGAATRYWTPFERNTQVPAIAGDFLAHLLIWLGVATAVLAAAYGLFRFQAAGRPSRAVRRAARLAEAAGADEAPQGELQKSARPVFDARAARAQLWARTKLDAAQVFKSPAYFVLLGLTVALSVGNLWFSTEIGLYGGKIWPVSRVMIQALSGIFPAMTLIIAAYYAGELVWREKDRRTHEIIDAAPAPDWMFVLPKTLAISIVTVSTLLAGVAISIITQALRGYDHFQVGAYLLWWVIPTGIDLVLIAVLAVFIQTLVPHKFIGWAVMAVYLISTLVLNNLGFEDNLYQYAGGPPMPVSDMNGIGHYWIGAYWFRLYWSGFALILLVLAYALWRRGTETRLRPRLRQLPRRLAGTAGVVLGVGLAVFVSSGAWAFYNTHVLNPYRTSQGDDKWAADYETLFLRYESLPQPKIIKVKLAIQVWPHQTRVDVRGVYLIQNRTAAPISQLHVRFVRDLKVDAVVVTGAHLTKDFGDYNYRIYTFDKPMQPGEIRAVAFITTLQQQGFKNGGNMLRIMDNGTFVNSGDLTPHIGMDRSFLLQDRAKRRKYKLRPADLRMPKLGTPGADAFNYIGHDSDWVTADVTVTTDADQTPIAPGYEVSQSVANGRRTVRFVTDSPILNFFSAQSARYAVSTVPYKGVNISVYYDPQHPWNVGRIQKAMEASLDYYQANYSPYQFHQVRVLEFPDPQGQFAESFANTIPWSEGIFFIADNRDPDRIDMVTYVGAHELGHQWWAHQVIGADEQGGTMLSETLAQYSAAMVMKHMYGPDMMRKFLKYELDSYLRARGGDILEEQPLERVENQPYVHYRKGSLVMYRLQDQIGEAAVDRALRHLLHDYAFKGPPYPTSAELVKDIRAEAPADKQQLITDLFEKITLYNVKASHAVAKQRPDGRYDLTFTVDAKKVYADGSGHETPAPMNETLDVGAFDVSPADSGYNQGKVIAVQRVPIHTGVQTVSMVVSRAPKYAGVDPFAELIDRDANAAITKVGS